MILTASLSVLFSKTERYLLQNQAKFVLNDTSSRRRRETEDKLKLEPHYELKASDRKTEIDRENL